VATAQQIQRFEAVINQLSTVAYAAVKRLLLELDDSDAAVLRDRLFAAYPELVAPFVEAAGVTAAQWYSEVRAEADVGGSFAPVVAASVPADQARGMVFRAMSPRFGQSGSTVFRLLSGSTQRLIAGGARNTIEASSRADRVRVGYQRMPAPGCCAFCGMLASRGPIYRSEETASSIYTRYHDHCRCIAVPVFSGKSEINSVLEATQAKYLGMYQQSVGTQLSAYSREHPGTEIQSTALKPTLANWRERFGTH